MTITPQPNLIEQSDFTAGYMPDLDPGSVPATALLDVLNLLPESSFRRSSNMPQGLVTQIFGGTLATRPGFEGVVRAILGDGTHYIRQVFHAGGGGHGSRLILLLTDESSSANNVQLHQIKMSDLTHSRMDTAGRTWLDSKAVHWGQFIGTKWYGGVEGEAMYSWNVVGHTWVADASSPDSKAWVNAQDDSVTVSTQYARDHAFRGQEVVTYGGSHYTPANTNRFETWNNDTNWYKVNDKVSHWAVWASTVMYGKSFKCVQAHDPGDADTEPGVGANWTDFWQKLRLDTPTNSNDSSSVNDDWNLLVTAAETSVATWHAERLWLRYDDQDQYDRVQFSAPLQPKHGSDIAVQVFDPTDFAPGDDLKGEGGGWIPFSTGRGHAAVTCMVSYGQYLVTFKRDRVFVLSGTDEATFNVRLLSEAAGAISSHAATVHQPDGMCYFLGDDGLYVTDGTQVDAATGMGSIRETFRARIALYLAKTDNNVPRVNSWREFVVISIPVAGNAVPYWTMFYHPSTQSFWLTDLPILDGVTFAPDSSSQQMYFSTPLAYGKDNVYQLALATTDDVGGTSYTTTPIAWHARFPWYPFGTARMQRRIRRTWALIKGALTYTLTTYRDYDDTKTASVARTVTATAPYYIEGEWVPDAHAISYKLSSTGVGKILGVAADTEPRRMRYHTGGG